MSARAMTREAAWPRSRSAAWADPEDADDERGCEQSEESSPARGESTFWGLCWGS